MWHIPCSPHTRGCSCIHFPSCKITTVFPAYAGVFLGGIANSVWNKCVPRIRGGVPIKVHVEEGQRECSPHTRGCSSFLFRKPFHPFVFPAYAGVFLPSFFLARTRYRVPRIRGGVPYVTQLPMIFLRCSPHTRGCSLPSPTAHRISHVFPAYAGVFLTSGRNITGKICVPRIRGGVPATSVSLIAYNLCSPHTRGCSYGWLPCGYVYTVFPAYAGVFLFSG